MRTADSEFYSDREGGAGPRDRDQLPQATARGLLNLVQTKLEANWFAKRFPEQCYDGRGVVGTVFQSIRVDIQALIPDIAFPLLGNDDLADETIFDLVEYAAQRVAEPSEGDWHSGLKHHELAFNEKSGRKAFRSEVNQILARGRAAYELSESLQVHRLGTVEVRKAVADLTPNTGDEVLDDLVVEARQLYTSHRRGDRKTGIDKLWDAFERLKTIDLPSGDKRASADRLLLHIDQAALRAEVAEEMRALTAIGNTFNIRHHETGKHIVPLEAYDYFFARMSNLMVLLLRESGRLL